AGCRGTGTAADDDAHRPGPRGRRSRPPRARRRRRPGAPPPRDGKGAAGDAARPRTPRRDARGAARTPLPRGACTRTRSCGAGRTGASGAAVTLGEVGQRPVRALDPLVAEVEIVLGELGAYAACHCVALPGRVEAV